MIVITHKNTGQITYLNPVQIVSVKWRPYALHADIIIVDVNGNSYVEAINNLKDAKKRLKFITDTIDSSVTNKLINPYRKT